MQEYGNSRKALIVATISGFITSFEKNNIAILQDLGYQVHLACNTDGDAIEHRLPPLKEQGVVVHHIPFTRSPFSKGNIAAYKQLKQLMLEGDYDLVHCHTPVGGVLGRMAAHAAKVPYVLYTAHGFHFFDGAPKKYWLIFYPVEKFLSRWTDALVTITREDFDRARNKFSAKKTVYIPGVGLDTARFSSNADGRAKIRTELGLNDNDFMLLSIGELNTNKNHSAVIKAIAGMDITYAIAGRGDKDSELQALALEQGVDLRLLGYRNDVADLYYAADAYILPSLREGLNVSLMEAMASGKPCLCGKIRGNVDLIEDRVGGYLFDTHDIASIQDAIKKTLSMTEDGRKAMGQTNQEKIKNFDKSIVEKIMREQYQGIVG